MATLPMTLSDP